MSIEQILKQLEISIDCSSALKSDLVVLPINNAKILLALIADLTEENKSLRATQTVTHIHIDEQLRKECEYEMQQVRAATVREMAQRLKANAHIESTITGYRYAVVDVCEIDNVAREIL